MQWNTVRIESYAKSKSSLFFQKSSSVSSSK